MRRRRQPVGLRFALAAAAYGLALLGLRRSPGLIAILEPLELRTAEITAALLNGLGLEAWRRGTVISQPGGFSYEIDYPCTGLTVAGFLIVGLLALPGRRRAKLGALAAGVALVLGLNMVRLLHLFAVGVWYPWAFDFLHRGVWEVVMLGSVMAWWFFWLRRQEAAGRLAAAPGSVGGS